LLLEIFFTVILGIIISNNFLYEKIIIRNAKYDDIQNIVNLEIDVWGKQNAATAEQIKSRINFCSKGNIIAEYKGEIIGYTSYILINYDDYLDNINWYNLTDNGNCKNFNPKGSELFGVNLSVKKGSNSNLSKLLIFEGLKFGIKNNVKRWLLGSRVPRFYKHSKNLSIEEYVYGKNNKKSYDPELRFYNKFGVSIKEIVPNYFIDPESLNYGVIIELKNPFYSKWIINKIIKFIIDYINPVDIINKAISKK